MLKVRHFWYYWQLFFYSKFFLHILWILIRDDAAGTKESLISGINKRLFILFWKDCCVTVVTIQQPVTVVSTNSDKCQKEKYTPFNK